MGDQNNCVHDREGMMRMDGMGSLLVCVGSTAVDVEKGHHAMDQALAIRNTPLLFLIGQAQLVHSPCHCLHAAVALQVTLISPVWCRSLEQVFMPAGNSADLKGKVSHMQHFVLPFDDFLLPQLIPKDKDHITQGWRVDLLVFGGREETGSPHQFSLCFPLQHPPSLVCPAHPTAVEGGSFQHTSAVVVEQPYRQFHSSAFELEHLFAGHQQNPHQFLPASHLLACQSVAHSPLLGPQFCGLLLGCGVFAEGDAGAERGVFLEHEVDTFAHHDITRPHTTPLPFELVKLKRPLRFKLPCHQKQGWICSHPSCDMHRVPGEQGVSADVWGSGIEELPCVIINLLYREYGQQKNWLYDGYFWEDRQRWLMMIDERQMLDQNFMAAMAGLTKGPFTDHSC